MQTFIIILQALLEILSFEFFGWFCALCVMFFGFNVIYGLFHK